MTQKIEAKLGKTLASAVLRLVPNLVAKTCSR